MIKIKQIEHNSIYLLEGLCTANTHFIENEKEVRIFLNLINRRLGQYMSILEYVIKPTGWQLIVKTKSEYKIKTSYFNQLKRKNIRPKRVLNSVNLIISEAIRILRSRFTNITNPLRGREGNASKKVFQKYQFSSIEEARKYIRKIRDREVSLDQPNMKYQANPRYFDQKGELLRNPELLSSKSFHEEKSQSLCKAFKWIKRYDFLGLGFEKSISKTIQKYFDLVDKDAKKKIKKSFKSLISN